MVEIHGGGFLIGGPPNGSHLAGQAGDRDRDPLPARNPRFPREQGSGRTLRRLWIAGSAGRATVGTAEHRAFWRGSAQRHAVWPVCWRRERVRGGCLTDRGRPVPQRDQRKRVLQLQRQLDLVGAQRLQVGTADRGPGRGARRRVREQVGCPTGAEIAACLRALPVQTLVDNGGQILAPDAGGPIGPTINSTVLPVSPAKAFITGRPLNTITMMTGVARDEFNGGLYTRLVANSPAEYQELLREQFGVEPMQSSRSIRCRGSPIARRSSPTGRLWPMPSPSARRWRPTSNWPRTSPSMRSRTTTATRRRGMRRCLSARFTTPRTRSCSPRHPLARAESGGARGFIVAQWSGFARTGNPTVDGTPRWPLAQ